MRYGVQPKYPCKKCGKLPEYIEIAVYGPAGSGVRCPECGYGVRGSWVDDAIEKWDQQNEISGISLVGQNEMFHVHTYRCKHAGEDEDHQYVEQAIKLGAQKIIFTDHAPFPGNPFGGRMDIEELPEYIDDLERLREKYKKHILLEIGLEVEYLPSFEEYYRQLVQNEKLSYLVLGQHMYEHSKGVYSFQDSSEVKNQTEAYGLCDAMVAGLKTGYFRVLAHPDRAFKRMKHWSVDLEKAAEQVIRTAIATNTIIEQNLSSYKAGRKKRHYRPEFWELLEFIAAEEPERWIQVIRGLDAHAAKEISWDQIGKEK